MNLYTVAQSLIGTREISAPGRDNPLIMAMLTQDETWPQNDETAWCSAFIGFLARLCWLPRTRSLMARSWLGVGTPIPIESATPAWDIVILSRGSDPKAGHVGVYAGHDDSRVWLVGGNQENAVTLAPFEKSRIIGVRRLKLS